MQKTLGKWLKTDVRYLINGGGWLSFGQILSMAAGFGTAIIFANYLPKEAFGVYKYTLSISGILAIFSLAGMNTALSKSIALGYDGSTWAVLNKKILWGLAGALAGIVYGIYLYCNNEIEMSICIAIASALTPVVSALDIYIAILGGKKAFKFLALYPLINRLILFLSMWVIVSISGDPIVVVLTFFTVNALVKLLFFTVTCKQYPLNNKVEETTLGFGKHLTIMQIANTVAFNLDKILMFNLMGPTELSIYSIAISPVQQIQTAVKSFTSLSLPKLVDKKTDELRRTLPAKIFKSSLILMIPIGVYLVSAPIIFEVFFSNYMESMNYSRVLITGILFFPFIVFEASMIAHEESRKLYIVRLSKPAVRILLLLSLISFWGIYGAIAAFVSSHIIESIIIYAVFKIKTKNRST